MKTGCGMPAKKPATVIDVLEVLKTPIELETPRERCLAALLNAALAGR
jgi:hypothetical protein